MGRKESEKIILDGVKKIDPSGKNYELYKNLFKSMTNKEFEDFITGIRDEKKTLSIIVPSWSKSGITVENNFKIAKDYGYDFFQRLIIEGDGDNPPRKTNNKFFVYKLPIRRASQLLSKKISIPKDDKVIDLTTGQVTGKSGAAKLTMPETQMIVGMGLKHSVVELLKYRGGDLGSANAMKRELVNNGRVNSSVLEEASTKVVSTKTLKSYLNAAHIKSTL